VPLDAPSDVEVPKPPAEPKDRSVDDLRAGVVEKAASFIEDMLPALEPYDMQDFVPGSCVPWATRLA